jgi:hypothetical protein
MWLVSGICYKINKGRWLDLLSCVLEAVGMHLKLLIVVVIAVSESTGSGMNMTGDSKFLRNSLARSTKPVSANSQVHSWDNVAVSV